MKSCAFSNSGDQSLKYGAWVGKTLIEVISTEFRSVEKSELPETIAKHRRDFIKLTEPVDSTKSWENFWHTYDARSRRIVDTSGRDDGELFDGYYITEITQEFSGVSFWDWNPCVWLKAAIELVTAALETGEIAAVGQREPVLAINKLEEEIPYHAFDNRLWRLHREKNRLEMFDENGQVEAVFRRIRLVLPGEISPRHSVPPTAAAQSDVATAMTADQARAFMSMLDMTALGSKVAAEQFRREHAGSRLSVKRLCSLADDVRGYKLPRGRPKRSRNGDAR